MVNFPNFNALDLSNSYRKYGYLVVPFLGDSECDELIEIYERNADDKGTEFYTTMNDIDIPKKKYINQLLCAKIEEKLPRIVEGYHPIFGNFIVKKANGSYKVGIHQDWSYVDENKFRSFNVWVALCDTNNENGGLKVLPKSHLLPLPIRYTPFKNNLQPFERLIKLKAKSIEVKKGYAVIYDSALIHFSNANKSNQTRYAFGSVCIPDNAISKHYYRENDQLLEYDVNEDFYDLITPGEKPNAHLVDKKIVEKESKIELLLKLLML